MRLELSKGFPSRRVPWEVEVVALLMWVGCERDLHQIKQPTSRDAVGLSESDRPGREDQKNHAKRRHVKDEESGGV